MVFSGYDEGGRFATTDLCHGQSESVSSSEPCLPALIKIIQRVPLHV